jgi:guanylate kinase
MRLDPQGAATIRKLVPEGIFIFLMAESEQAMIQRLRERKSETAEGLNLRIATARQEMKRIREFDYVVVNAQARQEETVAKIEAIITAEHQRVGRRPVNL